MLPQSEVITRPMSVQSPAPARAASLRLSLLRRIEHWRSDLPALQLATFAAGSRIRVTLARDLDTLVAECDGLTRIVDEMAVATDGRAWYNARDRGEQGWSDLATRTEELRQKIERQRPPRRRGTKAGTARRGRLRLEPQARPAAVVEIHPPAPRLEEPVAHLHPLGLKGFASGEDCWCAGELCSGTRASS